ncbi:MAG: helix-turn-helix domain-containing protein [Solobacterium sp.]|nr:helix-turn-helix domain-containing protein [Solobacterium sp.]
MIGQSTAQQIVSAVRDVCGYDINYISPDGMIIASTDEKRIGDYHEIGFRAAHTGQTLEVYDNHTYAGAQKGINVPFNYHGTPVAVIGITGEPDEVRRYAQLALRIMGLILRERDLDASRELKRAEFSYVAKTLIQNGSISHEYLRDFLRQKDLRSDDSYRTVLISLQDPGRTGHYTVLENRVETILAGIRHSFYAYEYPDRYILIITEQAYQEQKQLIRDLAGIPAKISVGSVQRLFHVHRSYEDAQLAMKSGNELFIEFDDLYTELLFSDLSYHVKDMFLNKTIRRISAPDLELLKVYYDCRLSLKEASGQLFIHKNTLQYRLERIHRQCGLDPRNVRDASVLITAMRLADTLDDK